MNDASRGRALAAIPSIDRLLDEPRSKALISEHGRALVVETLRGVAAEVRRRLRDGEDGLAQTDLARTLVDEAGERIARDAAPTLKPVINLTGTVLHTNLGRAPLPAEAIDAMVAVSGASNLELDLDTGRRGERDSHVEGWLRRLTGAGAATVVNNNAAAVLISLNTLASRKQVPVSRGELIEIGGAFRMPDIMARAGCKIVEVGTTNRTHLKDYETAIGDRTGALLKVHTSNYEVQGFTASVGVGDLSVLARKHDIPLIEDLGSGTLVDLTRFGLPKEPTARDSIEAGADVVTFSGDKLLGGPQCGLIVGRADVVARIKRNPLKRALRVDKMTLAALGAILPMYADPDRLPARIPALRQLTRSTDDIAAQAERLVPKLRDLVGDAVEVEAVACESQIGSGALPLKTLPSVALRLRPRPRGRASKRAANKLADDFRALPIPVIGRVRDDSLWLDLRCLDDERRLLEQLPLLSSP